MNQILIQNEKVNRFHELMTHCTICPRRCGVNRTAGQKGKCNTANEFKIASYNLHFGEEPAISGFKGSGTIFFANCALSCVFCQNYPISQLGNGNPSNSEELASIMMKLQGKGAHNINFITPSHVASFIVEAFYIAKEAGLNIPLVYNCSGYESVETLRLLEGIVDIYMPDAKYIDPRNSKQYSGVYDYWEVNKLALKEMHRQVGTLQCDSDGIAQKGLIVRHLVLPNNIANSKEIFEFIAGEISTKTHMSIMAQYHTANKADAFPELCRKITTKEYSDVLKAARDLHLEYGWLQELE